MPYVNIKLAGSVTKEQKAEIAKEVTETLMRVANKPASYTYITFEEVEYEDWAIGGKLLG
jgi:4-oxalocrotonate tautomerase